MTTPGFESLHAALIFRSGKRQGDEIIFRCPYPERHNNADRNPSASCNTAKHTWCCFACGAKGTAQELATLLGIDGSDTTSVPPESLAPRGVYRSYKGSKLTAWWIYKDRFSQEIGVVGRYEDETGKKQFVPYFRKGDSGWVAGAAPAPRPLFGLDWLWGQLKATVIVVEGEKCATRLQKMGMVAVTSAGGSSGAGKADWSVLKDRTVCIFPDNDEPGRKYAETVSVMATAAGATSVHVLDVAPLGLGAGGDVVDWLDADLERGPAAVMKLFAVEEGPRFALVAYTLEEFLDLRFPPREVLVDPWLRAKDLCMFYGWRGAGKTYVSLSLALALITGSDFMKWKSLRARNVLLVDGEMPKETLQLRLAQILQGQNRPTRQGRIEIISADCQSEGIPSLATKQGQDYIGQYLAAYDYDAVILDNIATLCGSDDYDENSTESWRPMQTWLLSLRRRGISVILMHHAGKGGKQRGTSAREDILDTVVSLERPHDYEPLQGARFILTFEKARSLAGQDIDSVEARLIDGQNGGLTWELKNVRDNRNEEIVRMYCEDQMNVGEIATDLKINKSTVMRVLRGRKIKMRGRWGGR